MSYTQDLKEDNVGDIQKQTTGKAVTWTAFCEGNYRETIVYLANQLDNAAHGRGDAINLVMFG